MATTSAAEELSLEPLAIEARLRSDVEYLASEELEGRGVRTKGIDLAAEFIARQYAAAGLNTQHYQGTPFQEFMVYTGGSSGSVQSFIWKQKEEAQTLVAGEDYTSLMVTSSGNFSLPLAFAGYGITAPEYGYDDYAGLDVRGRAVVLLRQEPQSLLSSSKFNGDEPTKHAYLMSKVRNAVRHGAAAVILCTDHAALTMAANEAGSRPDHADPLLTAELTSGVGDESIPVVHCRRQIVEHWLKRLGKIDLTATEQQIDETLIPRSRLLPEGGVDGRIALSRPGRKLRNIIGTIEGEGPLKEETILVGAHYDHLGRGGWGSLAMGANGEIHNGADDNASGTAVLLEAARQWAARPVKSRRRVMFVAFTGEELGLYGSKRYVQTPLVPLTQTVAMLNLDMVGRVRQDKLTVYGVGTAEEWPQWVHASGQKAGLHILGEPSGFGPSDHAPFHERGVPVLHFFSGFHPEYHRPPDDVALLNIEGIRRVTQMLLELVESLDQAPVPPHSTTAGQPFQFTETGELSGLLLSDLSNRPRVLGVVLQITEKEQGLRIRQVQADSLAAHSGLLVDDLLLRLDGHPLASRTDLSERLERATTGVPLILQFERGGVVREIPLKF